MRALKRAEEALEAPDHATALKAGHTIASLAGALVKLVEVVDLQERVTELEEMVQSMREVA